MSATSLHLPALPSYRNPGRAPEYTRSGGDDRQRLPSRPQADPAPLSPTTTFSKQSRTGEITLELYGQLIGARLPTFANGDVVKGRVLLPRSEMIARVTVKIDGQLRIQEIGGAGRNVDKIVGEEVTLWTNDGSICPSSLEFAAPLPATYSKDSKQYTLPPTIEVHLTGVPGFKAEVSYSISAHLHRSKGSLFGNQVGVSTPFAYLPRTRPLHPIPPPTSATSFSSHLVHASPGWEIIESIMQPRSHFTNPIIVKLFIPSGRTYSLLTPIPFRLHVASNALSLATYLLSAPTSLKQPKKKENKGSMRISVIRQVSVDVQNAHAGDAMTDIFKSLSGGEGIFRRLSDGPEWAAWEGEITLDTSVMTVGSFKAGGLWLRDILVLSITPPDLSNSPFKDVRKLIPIQVVTDPHASQAAVDQLIDWSDGDVKLDIPDM